MKFKKLSEEQRAHVISTYFDKECGLSYEKRATMLSIEFEVSERTIRYWWSNLGLTEKKEVEPEQYAKAKTRIHDESKKCFIITWAQNATKTNTKLVKNIEAYGEHINASIHVIAGKYKNLSLFDKEDNNDYWDDSILQYLDANRHNIHKYVSIMGDVKTQPTAVNPMSGMEGMSRENTCIFGHPKIHMQMIPVLNEHSPKMMLTTGAITELNYSESKSGKKSEFHHQYGFVVVEIENDDVFHVRQVVAEEKDGSFYDLFFRVKDGVVSKINKIDGIVLGDLHCGEHDEKVLEKTFEIMDILTPKNVVLHDVFNGESISHHTINDPFIQFGLDARGKNSLKGEIDILMTQLNKFVKYENVIIVKSNHDTHLDRFLTNDWRKLPTSKNSIEYMEYSKMLLEQHSNNNVIGIIPELINKRFPKFKTLNYNDSYKIKGYEVSIHGDIGANGSRGSATQFRKLNTKLITGHTHSPSRFDNSICVGTSTKLRLSYNKGASGWLQSHVLIFPNGKAQHINFVGENKTYTTFK